MGKIYTGIELGSSSIKVLVLEVVNGAYHVLTTALAPSKGIKKKEVVDVKSCASMLQIAVRKAEEQIGMKIEEAILVLPPYQASFTMEKGEATIFEKVTGTEMKDAMRNAVLGKDTPDEEIVSILPISFSVDDGVSVLDPKGERGELLTSKVVMSSIDKAVLYPYLQVCKSVGIRVVDLVLAPQADYATCETKDFNRKMGAIINIGEEMTAVSIFNKGILIKNENLSVGSLFVDKDLAYIYKVNLEVARNIKETFAITSSRYADSNEWMEVVTLSGERITINQAETSKIIESRLGEILKLAKSAINNLTKREISYIIVVGGISELAGFTYLMEDVLGPKASVWNMQELGARHNQFTTVFGSCKYYHQRCTFLEKEGSMFSEEAQNNLIAPKKKGTLGSEVSLNKFFGHFFDN